MLLLKQLKSNRKWHFKVLLGFCSGLCFTSSWLSAMKSLPWARFCWEEVWHVLLQLSCWELWPGSLLACLHTFLVWVITSHHCSALYLKTPFVSCCNTEQCCFVQSSLLMPFGNGAIPSWIESRDWRARTAFQTYRYRVCKEWGPNLRWQENQPLKVLYE